VTAALAELTLEQLADLFDSGDAGDQAAVIAEADRRDRADRARQRSRERYAAASAEWRDAAHAQYLDAEATTRGYLLSRQGLAEGIEDPFVLWSGPAAWAMARASEELRNYWLNHPRLTVTEYGRQRVAARRAARDDDDLAAMPAESEETEVTETYEDVPEAELEDGGDGVTRRGTHGAMSYADIEAVELEWLWDGRIPLGEVTVLAAMGGTGKTFAMCDPSRAGDPRRRTARRKPARAAGNGLHRERRGRRVDRAGAPAGRGPRRSVAGDRLLRTGRRRVRPR
jgi:hypothetical protein